MASPVGGAASFAAFYVAWALGYPDGEKAPWTDVLKATARIVRAAGPEVAVSADIESGYGSTPDEVADSVRAIVAAGAVGINIEDSLNGALRAIDDAVSRIKAARAAADSLQVPLFINARTDSFWRLQGATPAEVRHEAVRRAQAYIAAGANGIFPFGLAAPDDIASFVKAVEAPVNILASHRSLPLGELARMGVRRVTFGGAATLAVASTVRQLAGKLQSAADLSALQTDAESLGYQDMQLLFAGG